MDMNKKFVTSINCMDGRTQEPIITYLKTEYGADYVDMITEPGPNKILAENTNTVLIESIKTRVEVSTGKHDSKVIAIVGHYDCGGNPADEATQKDQINASVTNVKSWYPEVDVIGVWVDEAWKVNRVV
ncbi:carbonic anhydrase [Alkaliphilus hydrothermalis]|uniref:Carbonic anhydrase n=1 Tax=Alkaliphilus hydrothermalis TaxID=1482730 RepID=A0ABS2NPQ7_9FIRM|nr:carbonic anhydrase [Alkaliphilus hydrothermalis]MBM7614930.1 carbonic anhydrase [Alkaliphilus hydrothermalis]